MTEAEWLASESPGTMLRYLQEGCGVCDGTGSLGGAQSPKRPCERCGGRQPAKPSDRKLRLFACHVTRMLVIPEGLPYVAVAEDYADGQIDAATLDAKAGSAGYWCAQPDRDIFRSCLELCNARTYGNPLPGIVAQALRDIIGNPFRPWLCQRCARGPASLVLADAGVAFACRGCADKHYRVPLEIRSLAQAAYDSRDPATGHLDPVRLAVLADALEEAGCDAGLLCVECVKFGRVQAWEFMACHGTPTAIIGGELVQHLHSPGPHVRGCWAVDLVLGRE